MPDINHDRSYIIRHFTIFSAVLFLLLLIILHILNPEIDPSRKMISEYETGRFGWMMQTAFFFLALSCMFFILTVKTHIHTRSGKLGLLLLSLTIMGLFIAGIFKTQSIVVPHYELTNLSLLHNLGLSLTIFSIPFVSLLISISLIKSNERWTLGAIRFLLPLIMIWGTLVWFIFTTILTYQEVSPSPIGWSNRALMLSFCWWLIAVAHRSRKISTNVYKMSF